MPDTSAVLEDVLTLTLLPGIGPTLARRAIAHYGSASEVLADPARRLAAIRGVGAARAKAAAAELKPARDLARREIDLASKRGVTLLALGLHGYPPLLAPLDDAPPILYIRGRLDHAGIDRYPVAIVGSRSCTHYGSEQAARFGAQLASSGLTVISGGARGIDAAAHRGALDAGGRTVAVVGCGLGRCYPQDHQPLFDRIADGGGAVVSEFPFDTEPRAENFPRRNRIISGLSLGVIVIEAGRRSGALITARLAAEEHGREVFALPGRVDSSASEGSLELLKSGGAALVTCPADVIDALESPARHLHADTHAARFADPGRPRESLFEPEADEPGRASAPPAGASRVLELKTAAAGAEAAASAGASAAEPSASGEGAASPTGIGLTDLQRTLLEVLREPRTLDELASAARADPAQVRAALTILELRKRVVRQGTRVVASRS